MLGFKCDASIVLLLYATGVESRPRSIAGRIVAVVWIIFVLDTLFIYLAALVHNIPLYYGPAAMSVPPPSLDNIVDQNLYKFVAVSGSSAQDFFANSGVTRYQKINASLEMVSTFEDGISRVKSGDAVLFLDSSYADYYTSKNCELVTVGSMLNANAYALALSIGASLIDQVNMKILELHENGKLQQISKMWFHTSECETEVKVEMPVEVKVGMDGYGGPVILFILGMLVALVVAMLEALLVQKRSKVGLQARCNHNLVAICLAYKCIYSDKVFSLLVMEFRALMASRNQGNQGKWPKKLPIWKNQRI